jgi:hypothetical protein
VDDQPVPERIGPRHLPEGHLVSALISNPSAASAAERERLLGVSVLLRQAQVGKCALAVPVGDEPGHLAIADVERTSASSLWPGWFASAWSRQGSMASCRPRPRSRPSRWRRPRQAKGGRVAWWERIRELLPASAGGCRVRSSNQMGGHRVNGPAPAPEVLGSGAASRYRLRLAPPFDVATERKADGT